MLEEEEVVVVGEIAEKQVVAISETSGNSFPWLFGLIGRKVKGEFQIKLKLRKTQELTN